MRPKQFVVKPGDRDAALSVVGTNVAVHVSAADSKNQQVTLQSGDAGTGPPPHSHDWDESFYVTRGQVEFTCAGETTMCVAGTFVYVPAGIVHAFSYGPGGRRVRRQVTHLKRTATRHSFSSKALCGPA
jgi:quercetin dioxygenase-like cupin family protein